MLHRALLIVAILGAAVANAQSPLVAKVSALSDGSLLLDGKPADLGTIKAALGRLKASGGVVWYHRQNPQAEPTAQAMAVIAIIVEQHLPVSMSAKPDFSDYVDDKGNSLPRANQSPSPAK